jgi:hypothetical protein
VAQTLGSSEQVMRAYLSKARAAGGKSGTGFPLMSRDTAQISFGNSQIPFGLSCVFVGTRRISFNTRQISSGISQILLEFAKYHSTRGAGQTIPRQSRLISRKSRLISRKSRLIFGACRLIFSKCQSEIVRFPFIPGFFCPVMPHMMLEIALAGQDDKG